MPPLNLEDFGARRPPEDRAQTNQNQPPPQTAHLDEQDLERARLDGYEDGYRTGWDDAIRREAEDQGRITTEFARNLQEMGFTFHEARAHVMQALEPLLNGMVEKVLPTLISMTLGETVLEELMRLAAEAADEPIRIIVSPASRPSLQTLLSENSAVPFEIVEEATLAEGQVYLRSGIVERRIDMHQAVDQIGQAINSLYEFNERAFKNE